MKDTESLNNHIICIDGIIGCGKEEQLDLLRDCGYFVASGPNYDTPIGSIIRDHLKGEFQFEDPSTLEYLFAADRREHIALINNHIATYGNNQDKLCFTGRYKYSGVIYSNDIKLTQYANDNMPEAGLFIYLEIDPDKAISKINMQDPNNSSMKSVNIESLKEIQTRFEKMIYLFRCQEDKIDGIFPKVIIIDADQPHDKIHEQILLAIDDYIKYLNKKEVE